MKKLDWQVSPAIAGHYEVVNTTFPILESRIGRIDFRVITLDQANRIHELGSRYLKKISKHNKLK
ncbi:hypothetical protein ACR777_15135 [Sphingobacterium spiritivorum]|uniref:hypothetical protein n=1 Tax=Sphingobacterium spiritivorum TaxID=258 RepID=UPI003DA5B053